MSFGKVLPKEVAKLLKVVHGTEGWRVESGGKHVKVFGPDGARVTVPRTPRGSNSIRLTRGDLKRQGWVAPANKRSK